MTLFTYDLSIENISTVIDLFMVEGFKCLIKISLSILNETYRMFLEGGVEIETFQTRDEGFVDFLKRFSEELRMESHFLLT